MSAIFAAVTTLLPSFAVVMLPSGTSDVLKIDPVTLVPSDSVITAWAVVVESATMSMVLIPFDIATQYEPQPEATPGSLFVLLAIAMNEPPLCVTVFSLT